MSINIKRNQLKRVVIVGGGLGGLRLAEDLSKANLQVVLIDKNNFHQFPPLIYQIASAGIDPSSISFPFRQIFRKRKNFYFRMAEARAVFPDKKILQTSIGKIEYDYLVFAAGTTTNFYGNANIEKWAIPMKTVSEAMGLRNAVLSNLERALTCATEEERQELLNVVIVGGGATGVEIAGALSEMKRYVIPYDYPDMDSSLMHIYLLEAGDRLLAGMSQDSSKKAYDFLTSMGVDVQFGKMVTDYKDHKVLMKDGQEIPTRTFLCDVSFTIPQGSFVSLVGESGCGKSTIAALLSGSRTGYTGSVTLGGVPVQELQQEQRLRTLTLVPHNAAIFKGTVESNLRMAKPDADEAQLWAALEQVNLADFCRSQNGLQTALHEGGSNLSGGQRQRLAMARALLHDTPIYLFDEATSNVDAESENDIMRAIHSLAGKKTIILISHRLANVVHSDCIYAMSNGRVIEQGTHAELLAQQGAYSRLYLAQRQLETLEEEDA